MRSDLVKGWAEKNGIRLGDAQISALGLFQSLVLAANEYMNLTAITKDEDFAVKHFIDSMTLLPFIPQGASLIDIGTGAGFPGLVLRVMRDDIRLVLLDSLRKRINFLRETADMLGIGPVECVHARAEDWPRLSQRRFDICTARAVAGLDKLAGYALPLLKPGGAFLAMKGPDVRGELEKAKPAIEKKGGHVACVETLEISDGVKRSIVIIKKATQST